jgi:ankyrin repeat protein/tetratricopeptide (TPR) repeat protein
MLSIQELAASVIPKEAKTAQATTDATALKETGNQLVKQGKYQEALQKYEEAILVNSHFAIAWFNKGLMHKKLKQYDDALAAFQKTLEIDPTYSKAKDNQTDTLQLQKAVLLKEEGNRLVVQGDHQKALQKYDEAIAADATFATAWFNKGLMHKKLKQYVEALEAFQKTLAIDPTYVKAKLQRAEILCLQGRYREAWPIFTSLISKSSDFLVDATRGQFVCEQHMAAKVIFASVDLKLTKTDEIKILEFGEGMLSGFDGFKFATGQNIVTLLKEKARELSLPPLILNGMPGLDMVDHDVIDKELATLLPPSGDFFPEQLSRYAAIYGGSQIRPVKKPWILGMGDSVLNFTFENKHITHFSFETSGMQHTRPRALTFNCSINPRAASDKIRKKLLGATQFVLKKPDLEGGQGTIVVNDRDLDVVIEVLLCFKLPSDERRILSFLSEKMRAVEAYREHLKQQGYSAEKLQNKVTMDVQQFERWHHGKGSYFMVEEYITNKPITYEHKEYDATMRVAFLLVRDNGIVFCAPFACYWKLPPQPMDAECQLRDKTVSSFSVDRHTAAVVNSNDQSVVYRQLQHLLPKVGVEMMQRDIVSYVETQASEDKFSLLLHFANSLAHQGKYVLAEYYLNEGKKLNPNNYRAYHEFGMFYHMQGLYERAIASYTQALEKNPGQEATYFRRGITWLALSDPEKAEHDFRRVNDPEYVRRILIHKIRFHEKMHKKFMLANLFSAIGKDAIDEVEQLLVAGVDVNQTLTECQGCSPLFSAAELDRPAIIDKLLQAGAIVDAINKDGATALLIASQLGCARSVEKLLQAKADINKPDPNRSTPLFIATQAGNVEVVRILLIYRADPNLADDEDTTPLWRASQDGYLEIVRNLLEAGADVNKADHKKLTPLHTAARNNRVEIVELLLAVKGVMVNKATDEGATPLEIASQYGHVEVIRKLLAHKDIKVDQKANDGVTPLWMAAKEGHVGAVSILLRAGAGINSIDDSGVVPLVIAAEKGHMDVVTRLLEEPTIDICPLLGKLITLGNIGGIKHLIGQYVQLQNLMDLPYKPVTQFLQRVVGTMPAYRRETLVFSEAATHYHQVQASVVFLRTLKEFTISSAHKENVDELMQVFLGRHPIARSGELRTAIDQTVTVFKGLLTTDCPPPRPNGT